MKRNIDLILKKKGINFYAGGKMNRIKTWNYDNFYQTFLDFIKSYLTWFRLSWEQNKNNIQNLLNYFFLNCCQQYKIASYIF